jgi:hypothetical protein
MSLSTSRRSLNPMPHGAPGVASSMKRPNSGWNTGAVLSPLSRRQYIFVWSLLKRKTYSGVPRARSGTPPPCFRSSASLANASRISACLRESLTCLSWSRNFTTRYSIWPGYQRCPRTLTSSILPYLVAPKQSIALLSLCVAPDSEQLLPNVSESIRRIRSIRSSIPRFPICAHGSPSLSLPANREAFQWLYNKYCQLHILVLSRASHTIDCGISAYSKPMSASRITQSSRSRESMSRSLQPPRLEGFAQFVLDIVYLFIPHCIVARGSGRLVSWWVGRRRSFTGGR